MRGSVHRAFVSICLLGVAACGSKSEEVTEAAITESAAATEVATATEPFASSDATPAARPAAEPSGAAGEMADADTPKGAGDLSAYVGKWPFDKVNGVTWNDHPTVKAGIRKTVTDAAARKAILELPGPAAEIELHDGKVAAWACEAHNCGPHQWTVLVDPKSGATDVCYFDEEKLGDKSRWFLSNGKQEDRQGNCQLS